MLVLMHNSLLLISNSNNADPKVYNSINFYFSQSSYCGFEDSFIPAHQLAQRKKTPLIVVEFY